MKFGAVPTSIGARFSLYSPAARRADVRLFDSAGARPIATRPLAHEGDGSFAGEVFGAGEGALYKFVLDGREVPDPYARSLPFGVHGPARVEAPRHTWAHDAPARRLSELIVYELHVGTFTPEGTYCAAIDRLPYLADLGVTAVELMPLSSFPGRRGWGYDGVAHFAPFAPYGTPDDLRAFVDAAHGLGLFAILDVVYNHFGPAGNYLSAYDEGYFTREHTTPWGDALDYTNPAMRAYALENARYWLDELRFDGLRLDATHSIVDPSRVSILKELSALARSLDPPRVLFAEDERNDPRLITEEGLDAVWADDFHHQVRVLLTHESEGYFAGYRPSVADLARRIERGWLYEGQALPSGKPRGRPCEGLRREQLVYCIQNHDQIGNRAMGRRLHQDASVDAFLAATTLLLFLPATPLLFMGQEWAASTPFLYFCDHDEALGAMITAGRREEFKGFRDFADPKIRETIPSPQDERTFLASKLRWDERLTGEHARALDLHRRMLRLRRDDEVLASPDAPLAATADGDVLCVTRSHGGQRRALLFNFGREPVSLADHGEPILRSAAHGPSGWLSPREAAVLRL